MDYIRLKDSEPCLNFKGCSLTTCVACICAQIQKIPRCQSAISHIKDHMSFLALQHNTFKSSSSWDSTDAADEGTVYSL